MQLLEVDGKVLLRRHGIAVPRGALWPELPSGVEACVVKAQIAAGKRGKRGGIRFASSPQEASAIAHELAELSIGEHKVAGVYVEERLDIERELYLAVALDRDARCHCILASPDGGMEIEAVPANRLLRLPIDPQLGLRPFQSRRAARFLDLPPAQVDAAMRLVAALHQLALAEDADLAEINPLVLTRSGALVAADAKVSLDPNAAFRHPDRKEFCSPPAGSDFEQAVAAAGSVAIDVDPAGTVVGVVSGAGLMMATLDLLTDRGIRPRSMIDLGGVVLGGAKGLVPVFRAVAGLEPRVTFINAYLQTALCDELARGFAEAHEAAPLRGRVILRLKGRNDDDARALLAPLGFEIHQDLSPALAAVATAAGEAG